MKRARRMRRAAAAAAFAALAAAPAGAQEAWPQDAPSLLAWHARREPPPLPAEQLAQRCFVYVKAGAAAEARAAADALDELAPGHPDAARFRVEVDAWLPVTRRRGLQRARAWLERHAGAGAAETRHVRQLRDFLAAELRRRARVEEQVAELRWLPWACMAAAGSAMLLAARTIR